ncbi:Mannose-1-phosphate guanylyltransferase [hydrothermal vent metagenome]|uniref:Mannose-1-phosphate guanylyltransferase n=1 Tax=hydrothermal vent metagenome TaxID=652676 RepID=A0A1W1C8W5_9ZZZZ
MKAVILSGGKGTRVQPLTFSMPKPMVPILERPLIGHLLEVLKKNNFLEVMITVSYKADIIENHYQSGRECGMQISYSMEGVLRDDKIVPEGLGSAGGLKKVQNNSQFFDEPFLVICGDALIDLDLEEVMKFHKNHEGKATIVCQEIAEADVSKYGVVVRDENKRITSFQEKPSLTEAKSNLINTGIYIFDPCILEYIPQGQAFDIGGELLPLMLEKNIEIYATSPKFQWLDVGTVSDFFEVNMMALENTISNVLPTGEKIQDDIWMGSNCQIDFDSIEISGPVYIGNSVKIEEGVKITGPCVIASHVVITKNVSLNKVIVLEHTCIKEEAVFDTRIITPEYLCDPYAGYLEVKKENLGSMIENSRRYEIEMV